MQLTEALTEYWHRRIREEFKSQTTRWPPRTRDSVEDYCKLGYRGARYSFGYGACPNWTTARRSWSSEPGRIGVELSEELQLLPEQSTDAFVLHHPEAKYFNLSEQLDVRGGPLRHRLGRGAVSSATRSLASCG